MGEKEVKRVISSCPIPFGRAVGEEARTDAQQREPVDRVIGFRFCFPIFFRSERELLVDKREEEEESF